MDKVTLWTRQDERMLSILEQEGVFRVQRRFVEEKNDTLVDYYLPLYDHFIRMAEKRVPRPAQQGYPIWCSIDEHYMLRGIAGHVLLELSIDAERIIYFDSLKWDMVLNHMYIPGDAEDDKRFKQELKERGIRDSFTLLDDYHRRFYPDLAQRVIDSWERIFTIDEWNLFTVQANIWEIYPQDIVKIERNARLERRIVLGER